MASVFDLPDEILLKIFSYLDVYDISHSITLVCEHWNNLSKDSMLWNKLVFKVDRTMQLSVVLDIIHNLTFVKRVELQWRIDTSDIIKALVKYCPHLIVIKMICCGYISRTCIEKLSNSYKNLKTLSLAKCWVIPRQCLDDIVLLTNLTELSLSHSSLTSIQFRLISMTCLNIVSLNIDYVRGICEEDLVMFLSTRYSALESLSVFGELLTDNVFQYFEKCCKLKLLHISTCRNFSDTCFTSFDKLKNLKSLTLRKAVKFSPEVLHNFYFFSGIMKNLLHLYISAKRNINRNDISLWYNKGSNIAEVHMNQYCMCILTKNGFSVDVRK